MAVKTAELGARCIQPVRNAFSGHEVLAGFDLGISPKASQLFELGLIAGDLELASRGDTELPP